MTDPVTPRVTIDQAIAHHQAGRLTEAESVYRKVLESHANSWDAWHLLGVLLTQQGKFEAGVTAIKTAIQGGPANPVYYFNLANIYQKHADNHQAIPLYQKAIDLHAGYNDAYVNLLAALMAEKRFDEAESVCHTLLRINPALPLAYFTLGNIQVARGDAQAAIKHYSAALGAKPDYIDALMNQGAAYKRLEDFRQAIAVYQQAVTIQPGLIKAQINIADALMRCGDFDAAIQRFDAMISSGHKTADLYCRLGDACEEKGLHRQALDAFKQAVAIDSQHIAAYTGQGQVYEILNRLADAVAVYSAALEIDSHNNHVRLLIGNVLASAGDFSAAEDAYRHVLNKTPCDGGAYYLLSLIKRFKSDDQDLQQMRACLNADALSVTDRMNISFALGKAFDDCGQYDEAFEYYLQANSLKRQTFNYSIEIDRQRLQRLQAVFTPALITEKQGHGLSDWQPIFIVGMPRSGTTLIESILAAHSQLQGVGELDDLRQILTPDYEVYNGIDTIGSETLRNLANDYFQRTEVYTHGLRPIDKMPSNFWRIGMLKLLFPQAIIIHCCRNAMDTCVSIFKQNFSGAHRYAYSLTELGQYYNVYQSVMAYWHQLFPGSIHDVHYEQLVADPEAESRRLLSLVGVEWEPACAEFYRRDRSIQTVSLQQARQPVYASSVGGWRRYEPFLEALTNQPGLQHE